MSFAPAYAQRFAEVIEPAIRSLSVDGRPLSPHRVDITQRGDSILTEIIDGIAHSRLVLADLSSVGKDSVSGQPYRNGNVMYEVGVALACRRPEDVLLVRDDKDHFLFDVSTIPHMTLDFTSAHAPQMLVEALRSRLREQDITKDARVSLAIASMTNAEAGLIKALERVPDGSAMSFNFSALSAHWQLGLARLLDKGLIRPVIKVKESPGYVLTKFGRATAKAAAHLLPSEAPIKLPADPEMGQQSDAPSV